MHMLEVGNDVYSSLDEGDVVQTDCPAPLYDALDSDRLYMDTR